MQRKDLLKNGGIRNAEYYNMVETLDRLYAESAKGKVFTDVISLISSEANIKMAYRNLKNNSGSGTAGVDGMTFYHLRNTPEEHLVKVVRDKILNYQPKAVRRVYIPKPNGKQRPLGIPTVIDRLVQQSVLQIMEPICEAKFYDRSYGFRPNRSAKNAVAMAYKLAQQAGFRYVVDVDIKGFFDNVNHAKLLKQIWTLGIRDKNLISLISKMLKAPIMDGKEKTFPERGTPQGGVLSPLLANIVLNEFDWWIASQWENMQMRNKCKSDIKRNQNGSPNKGYLYERMRKTNLKECQLVRYADDFKIFCKTYPDAVKLKYAVEQWLMERLGLETSKEKSKITNLERNYSEFLGIKFKLFRKGNHWAVRSHMCDKAIQNQKVKMKAAIADVCRAHPSEDAQHRAVTAYNQKVVGLHNYYNMATMICADVHELFISIDRTMKCRAHDQSLSREPPPKLKGGMDTYFFEKYKASKQLRYINGMVIVPVAYCRLVNPMCHRVAVNRYTPSGREEIHRMLFKAEYERVLIQLAGDSTVEESMEYCDNRISRFVAVRGKCEITGKALSFENVACHRLIPKEAGGTDEYRNLRIIHKDVERLLYETEADTIQKLLIRVGTDVLNADKRKKLNEWRSKLGLEPIHLRTLNIL